MKRKTSQQKLISTNLIREVKKLQKQLQIQENIKFGRKAKSISFLEATKNPQRLAKFILNEGLK
jgi:hypothetical protein